VGLGKNPQIKKKNNYTQIDSKFELGSLLRIIESEDIGVSSVHDFISITPLFSDDHTPDIGVQENIRVTLPKSLMKDTREPDTR
jgi:hypothetical protein